MKDVQAETTPTSSQSLKSNIQFRRSIGEEYFGIISVLNCPGTYRSGNFNRMILVDNDKF